MAAGLGAAQAPATSSRRPGPCRPSGAGDFEQAAWALQAVGFVPDFTRITRKIRQKQDTDMLIERDACEAFFGRHLAESG